MPDLSVILMHGGDKLNRPPVFFLCNALTRAGIPCGGDMKPNTLGGSIPPGTILIVIGRKVRTP
jgi:hypothetical protein